MKDNLKRNKWGKWNIKCFVNGHVIQQRERIVEIQGASWGEIQFRAVSKKDFHDKNISDSKIKINQAVCNMLNIQSNKNETKINNMVDDLYKILEKIKDVTYD